MAEKTTAEKPAVVNPWKDYVSVYVPRGCTGEEDAIPVFINDRSFLVRYEEDILVPRPVATVLQQRSAAIKVSERVCKKKQAAFDEFNRK